MIGLFRRLFKLESAKLTDSEFKHYYKACCKRRITELEREYADLIERPYEAGRLSEIISELGCLWNERLRYEEIELAGNGNGTKNLWQIQNEVRNIAQGAIQQIAKSKDSDDKFIICIEGLLKPIYLLDEWEIEL